MLAYVHMALYKKQLFEDLRLKHGIYYEDVHIMPYLLLRCNKVVVIPFVGYNYYYRDGSITNSAHLAEKLYTDSFVIWEEHLGLYSEKRDKSLVNAVKKLMVEKYISHSIAGTVPSSVKKEEKARFNKYCKQLLRTEASRKYRLRLWFFRLLGSRLYGCVNRIVNKIEILLFKKKDYQEAHSVRKCASVKFAKASYIASQLYDASHRYIVFRTVLRANIISLKLQVSISLCRKQNITAQHRLI